MSEGQESDLKSIRFLERQNGPDWNELSKDCVAFANTDDGAIIIGIEDGETDPPQGQTVPSEWPEEAQARIRDRTSGVSLSVHIGESPKTGGQYLKIQIARSVTPASTTQGKYYVRVGERCMPLQGADIYRLMNKRTGEPWETMISLEIDVSRTDARLLNDCEGIKVSLACSTISGSWSVKEAATICCAQREDLSRRFEKALILSRSN